MPIISEKVFGKTIEIDFSSCDGLGNPAHDVGVYALITNDCPHQCPFCFVHKHETNKVQQLPKWDMDKFNYALSELNNAFRIYKVNATGGEPLMNIDLTLQVMATAKKIHPLIYTTINTSGVFLDELKQHSLTNINSITISRHHYNELINAKLFGHKDCRIIPSNDILKQHIQDMPIVDLTCNLDCDGIYNEQEVIKYCEFASQFNINGIGFVGLTPANKYCRKHMIDFATFNFDVYPNILLFKKQQNVNKCQCQNYVYASENGTTIKFYYKHRVESNLKNDRAFVFDGQNLYQGFGGEKIF